MALVFFSYLCDGILACILTLKYLLNRVPRNDCEVVLATFANHNEIDIKILGLQATLNKISSLKSAQVCYLLSQGQLSPAEADRGPRTLTHTEPHLCPIAHIYSITLSRQTIKLTLKVIDSAYQFNLKSAASPGKTGRIYLTGQAPQDPGTDTNAKKAPTWQVERPNSPGHAVSIQIN